MKLEGRSWIAGRASQEAEPSFRGVDPRTGAPLEPAFADATAEEVDRACRAASDALPALAADPERRARFLEFVAGGIEDLGEALLERASAESGLPIARLTNERGRTTGQLRRFAAVVREGRFLDPTIDHADPERQPPRPDVRRMQVPLGPVAVFGASNFPLAFSVAGGDTASAFAAGCPVLCKAHERHPGTSEMVARVIVEAVRRAELPAGTFSLLQGADHSVSQALVQHPDVHAVAFTGSLRGGRALFDLAVRRPDPIPVFAEMGSVNPVFLLPHRLARDPDSLASGLAASVVLGVGQFCTNPGVVVAVESPALDRFVEALAAGMAPGNGVLLHEGIRRGFDRRTAEILRARDVELVAQGEPGNGPCDAAPALFSTTAESFLTDSSLREEVFGPATLLVRCPDLDTLVDVASALEGQLTATLHADAEDRATAARLLPLLERRVGRIVHGGFPTGVEVCAAMVHGGPYPATTDPRSTSVGDAAILRFTRPVCYQDVPDDLLPPDLKESNPLRRRRFVDGRFEEARPNA